MCVCVCVFVYVLHASHSFMASDFLLIKPVSFDKTKTLIKAAEVENFNSFNWYLLLSTQNHDTLIPVVKRSTLGGNYTYTYTAGNIRNSAFRNTLYWRARFEWFSQ
jgi:hypothetical protein